MNYKCVIGDEKLVSQKLDYEIKIHNNSMKWIKFKEITLNNLDNRIIYLGMVDDIIICEATAVINKLDYEVKNKSKFVNEDTVYLCAFRTNKEYQNKGYFSRLYKFMENDLKKRGIKKLILGVEPSEVRNMMIYFKYGFVNYINSYMEKYPNGEKYLVNYYYKNI